MCIFHAMTNKRYQLLNKQSFDITLNVKNFSVIVFDCTGLMSAYHVTKTVCTWKLNVIHLEEKNKI
jgi:hypothetical protein